MLSGHDPGRKGSVAPLKAKVMIQVDRGMLANLRRVPLSHAGMPPNSLGGGCHRVSEQVARGEYNLQLPTDRKDEIGFLSARFVRMAEALSERERELQKEKRKAERLAQIDPLVGIPNRRYFEDRLEELIRSGVPFALAFVDLDKFKKVNDLLGHNEGDRCLRRIALWFEKHIRDEDLVSRYGGDEFCFVFPRLSREQAEEIMKRIHTGFVAKKFVEGVDIDFSYGIASFPADALSLDKPLELADGVMYRRKKIKSSLNGVGF